MKVMRYFLSFQMHEKEKRHVVWWPTLLQFGPSTYLLVPTKPSSLPSGCRTIVCALNRKCFCRVASLSLTPKTSSLNSHGISFSPFSLTNSSQNLWTKSGMLPNFWRAPSVLLFVMCRSASMKRELFVWDAQVVSFTPHLPQPRLWCPLINPRSVSIAFSSWLSNCWFHLSALNWTFSKSRPQIFLNVLHLFDRKMKSLPSFWPPFRPSTMEQLRMTLMGLSSSCHATLFIPAVESKNDILVSQAFVAGSCRQFHVLNIHDCAYAFGRLFSW